MELSSSVRLSEGGEQARNLLDKLTDLIEANSIFKPRLLRKNSFNLFIEHEITAPAGLKLESSVQRIAGRYSYGEVLTGAAACVEGVRNWQAVQVSNNALFEELIRLVGKNVPEGFDRLASAPPILAEKARGWCYQEWCGDCDGHGAHSCGRCDGEGTLRCEYCNGVGDVDCCRCRGRGYHLDE